MPTRQSSPRRRRVFTIPNPYITAVEASQTDTDHDPMPVFDTGSQIQVGSMDDLQDATGYTFTAQAQSQKDDVPLFTALIALRSMRHPRPSDILDMHGYKYEARIVRSIEDSHAGDEIQRPTLEGITIKYSGRDAVKTK